MLLALRVTLVYTTAEGVKGKSNVEFKRELNLAFLYEDGVCYIAEKKF